MSAAEAAVKTAGDIHPDSRPALPPIPVDAIAEHELTWSRSTAWGIWQQLAREGRAWKSPDGQRLYDRRHPQILKHLAREAGIADAEWEAAPPELQRESLLRCRFLEEVERSLTQQPAFMGRKEAIRKACVNVAADVLGYVVALPTFYEWKRKYEAAGRRRSVLMDRRGRTGADRNAFSREAWAWFESLWLTKQRRSVKHCWERVRIKADQMDWSWPEYSAVARRVRMEWPPAKADLYRRGEQFWRMEHGPKIVRNKHDLAGNAHWEIDHLRFDFWARVGRQRVRLWCSLIVDRASDLTVGWAITTNPSSDSLTLALRRAVKTHGAPLETTMDNGLDMKADSFGGRRRKWVDEEWAGGVFEQLGVTLHWCRKKSPWAKGVVEGMARTIHEHFDKLWPSYCGGSPASKPEGIDKWCAEHFGELPTLEEVHKAFAEWVRAYAERPSDADGIKPLSPRQRFERTRIAMRTLPDRQLNILLLKLTKKRKVTAKGVLHNGMHYTDDGGHMFKYQGREVRLRVDPDDISYVWVCDAKGAPLFIARQNYVKGTADDVRAGQARVNRARKAIQNARLEQSAAFDDSVMATLRAQAERRRAEAEKLSPGEPTATVAVAPILTPAAQAVTENSAAIKRAETRDALQGQVKTTRPEELAPLTEDELRSLAAPDLDDLAAQDEEELAECG